MITNNAVYDQVQKNVNLVELIKGYLELTPGRRAHKGNCPFHPDRSGSLMVLQEKNVIKCFGCGAEGGPVEFLMAARGMPKLDAVEELAGIMSSVDPDMFS